MYTALQDAYVTFLRAHLADVMGGEKAPLAVQPYAGELAQPDALVHIAPIVLVDLGAAADERFDEASEVGEFAPTLDLILVAHNASLSGANYAEGLALATWARRHLRTSTPRVDLAGGGARYPTPGSLRFTRTLSGSLLWIAKITITPRLTL